MDILDEIPEDTESKLKSVKKQEIVLFYLFFAMCFINGVVLSLIEGTKYRSLIGGIFGSFVWALLTGLVFGSILTLIPYKGLSYKQKFKRTVLLSAFVWSVIFCFLFAIQLPGM